MFRRRHHAPKVDEFAKIRRCIQLADAAPVHPDSVTARGQAHPSVEDMYEVLDAEEIEEALPARDATFHEGKEWSDFKMLLHHYNLDISILGDVSAAYSIPPMLVGQLSESAAKREAELADLYGKATAHKIAADTVIDGARQLMRVAKAQMDASNEHVDFREADRAKSTDRPRPLAWYAGRY